MLHNRIKLRRITKASLSRNAGITAQAIEKYLKRPSLQFSILLVLCVAMKHNFFADLAAQLPEEFTTYAPDPTLALQEELEQLREENKLLRTQVDTLKEVLGRR